MLTEQYRLARRLYLLLYFAAAVMLFGTYGACGYSESLYPTLALMGGIAIVVELADLRASGWRVSLVYLLLSTTYLALLLGVPMTAFWLSRALFADPSLSD
jgi:hypothetical protein